MKFDKPGSEGTLGNLGVTASKQVFLFAFILAMVYDYNSAEIPVIVKCTLVLGTIKKGKKSQLC